MKRLQMLEQREVMLQRLAKAKTGVDEDSVTGDSSSFRGRYTLLQNRPQA